MKKILSVFAAFALTATAHAEKLIVTYDAAGTLSSVLVYDENEEYDIPADFSAFLYDMDLISREKYIPKKEDIEEDKGEVEENNPSEEEISSIYETKKDAISTFAIVTKVTKTLSNDEVVTKVDVLYQGREQVFLFAEDIKIGSAPENNAELVEKSAENLKRGDVINVSFSFSGKIKTLNLLARLENTEIITDDTDFGYNFEKLYSRGGIIIWGGEAYPVNVFGVEKNKRVQYQFGVITDKQDGFYTITNKAGKADEMTDIYFLPETVCYICDVANKYEVSKGSVYDITKSYIPSSDIDIDGNIIRWDADVEYTYALSRTIDGIATDIIIFHNFK